MIVRVLGVLAACAAAAAAGELFNDRVAIVDPFPREVARGKSIVITGAVKGKWRNPELILIAPAGKTYLNQDNRVNGTDFTYTVRFGEGVGKYRMEIIAHTPDSIKSAARFTVWHGVARPAEEKEEPLPTEPPTSPDDHDRVVEKRFFRTLNAFRRSIGVGALDWNEAVAARAREHAARMAKARRRMHRFGGIGVREMLATGGAGPGGLSGSTVPWTNVNATRPFNRPALKNPGPRTWNHLVVFVLNHESLPVLFEQHFVREAAFRICAADPHGVEVAVGVARIAPERRKPKPFKSKIKIVGEITIATRADKGHVYYCVCFLQANDKQLVARQNREYGALLRRAGKREPEVLRALGIWGRSKAESALERLLRDREPAVSSAAWDGLLLLDEQKAQATVADLRERGDQLLRDGRYADAAGVWAPFAHVTYDLRLRRGAERVPQEAEKLARIELKQVLAIADADERKTALTSLRKRARGLPIEADVKTHLANGQ